MSYLDEDERVEPSGNSSHSIRQSNGYLGGVRYAGSIDKGNSFR